MPAPKSLAQVWKFLQQHPRANPSEPLHNLADVLVGPIRVARHFARNDFQFGSAAICQIKSRTRTATSPVKTGFRYFGNHTKCTLKSLLVCAPNRYLRTHAIYTSLRLKARDSTIPEGDINMA